MKRLTIFKLTLLAYIIFGQCLFAQNATIKVWKNGVPGAISDTSYKTEVVYIAKNTPRIYRVTDPSLDVYTAPPEKSNGTAVVICPGGGYIRLAADKEGHDVALWLNNQGISAFVLKYRLPSDKIMKDKSIGPLQDVQEAVRLVRRNAAKWHLKTNKIGVMGFSAGGHVASSAATHFNDTVYQSKDTTSARPDFSLLIYPVISMNSKITHKGSHDNLIGEHPSAELTKRFSNELQVTDQTPPAFLVHAFDDGTVPVENSINYALALKKNHVPCELHIYQQGGHGFGLAANSKGTESGWPDACLKWLKFNGFL